jgi:secondary thiamine-phosphate synthase enzyme
VHSDFNVRTGSGTQLLNITSQVREAVRSSGVKEGICLVSVPHTTAGVTVNEAADPSVVQDMMMELGKIVPLRDNYSHMEGNSAAHIKSTLVGSSCTLPVTSGDLVLGTWQGVFFCEFDGPRTRRVRVTLVG